VCLVTVGRGHVCWADLGEPRGRGPGYRRPVVVVSSDRFKRSRILTMIVAAITTSARAAAAPGNISLAAGAAGLDRDCLVNVSQLLTLDRGDLDEPSGSLGRAVMRRVDDGLRLVLGLV
jgi:mRNA interferase MazF